ncbi:helix-turn-helix domain-containing protein [Rubinisphaera margarita]|uniref:helix-turn-helix domain-containing protein n=1 Tax=Rubinisphaera margarita TaxID=2909586 RepID=UPI001EE94791|nr:helix-turn-helix domain-containing protein [Rubinisphaera margarita]MCG6158350.1 hypothetical protein [Rubinisphaera margarita]
MIWTTATPPRENPRERSDRLHAILRACRQQPVVLLMGEAGTGKTHLGQLLHEIENSPGCLLRVIEPERRARISHRSQLDRLRHTVWKSHLYSRASGTTLIENVDQLSACELHDVLGLVRGRLKSLPAIPSQPGLILTARLPLERSPQHQTFEELVTILRAHTHKLPSLRDQPRYIAPLVREFIKTEVDGSSRRITRIATEVIECLHQHDWPGNVRELKQVVAAAITQCSDGVFTPRHLPQQFRFRDGLSHSDLEQRNPFIPGGPTPNGDYAIRVAGRTETVPAPSSIVDGVASMERNMITSALEECQFNRTRAAQLLGISRVTLYNKMRRLGMPTTLASQND